MKAHLRKVIVNDIGRPVDEEEIAKFTANYITKGDALEYCRMLRKRIDERAKKGVENQ